MRRLLPFVTFFVTTAAGAAQYTGDQARQVMALLQSGRGACFVTRSAIDPATNTVEQAFCSCVATVNGTAANQAGEVEVIDVTLGPEQPCVLPPAGGPTPQERQNAINRVGQIDTEVAQLDNFLQNMDAQVDQYDYQNDPRYRAEVDAWKQDWADYGAWKKGQLQAERNSAVSVANAPLPGAPAGTPPPVGSSAPGNMPGLLNVPME
jgi:hypothetical protein